MMVLSRILLTVRTKSKEVHFSARPLGRLGFFSIKRGSAKDCFGLRKAGRVFRLPEFAAS